MWTFSWLPPTMPSALQRLVWASLSPLNSPSVSWGLFTLVLAPQALPLSHRASVHLSQLPGPSLCIMGLVCTCLGSPDPASMPRGLCACCISLPAYPVCRRGGGRGREGWCVLLSSPCAHPLHPEVCVHCRGLYAMALLGPPSVPRGLCVLEWFVCCATPGTPGPPISCRGFCGLLSVPQACRLVGATVHELFTG